MKRLLLGLGLLLAAADAHAQQALLQGGSKTAGHVPMYQQSGTGQPIVIDAGPAALNVGIKCRFQLGAIISVVTHTAPVLLY